MIAPSEAPAGNLDESCPKRVRRVVFVKWTKVGMGDNLNGLISAYWMSRWSNISLAICWPEGDGTLRRRPWRVARANAALCRALLRARQRLADLSCDALRAGHNGHLRVNAIGHGLRNVTWVGLSQCGHTTEYYRRFFSAKHRWQECDETLAISVNRGISSFVFADRSHPWHAWLRAQHGTPWQAAGAALRQMIDTTAPPAAPSSSCLHYRSHLMLPLTLNQLVPCVENATSVRVFTDLVSRHLALHDHARGAASIARPVDDYRSWLDLAQGCQTYWVPTSLFALTAAAASGRADVRVIVLPQRGGSEARSFTCDVYTRLDRHRPMHIGFP
jgi:hypothetical protein